jgi:hypothetical protein
MTAQASARQRPAGRGPFQVAYVPLDDRPVNLEAVRMLAGLAGAELLTPPLELLGSFTRPGDCEAISRWLTTLPASVAHVVVSLDMLCHGGLLASRAAQPDEDPEAGLRAAARLSALSELRAARPHLPISALGVLLRSSISVTSEDRLEDWRRIHAVATSEDAVAESLAERLAGEGVAHEVAAAYLAARRRNLEVHRAAIELVRRDTLDFLLLCQEDAAPHGIHVHEQAALTEQIEAAGMGARVRIQPGADEGGMLLLARTVLRRHKLGLAIQPHFGPGGPEAVLLYEDRSLYESLMAQLSMLGGRRGFGTHLLLHVLEGEPEDLFLVAQEGREFEGFRGAVPHVRAGWAVADVSCANGADPGFVARLLEGVSPFDLSAFAGWNTASNTVGSILAHLACREIGVQVLPGREFARRHLEFLASRFADDYLYQGRVRPRLVEEARRGGLSVFSLDAAGHSRMQLRVEEEMSLEFQRFWDENARRPLDSGLTLRSAKTCFTLPWPRLFEVNARVQLEVV